MFSFVSNLLSSLVGLRQKQVEAQAVVVAKKTIDATSVAEHLFERMKSLEDRLQEIERRNAKLERIFDRLSAAYDRLRKEYMKLSRICVRKGYISADEAITPPAAKSLLEDHLAGIL